MERGIHESVSVVDDCTSSLTSFCQKFPVKVTSFLQQHCNNEKLLKVGVIFIFLKTPAPAEALFIFSVGGFSNAKVYQRFHLKMFEFEANYAETSIKVHKYGAYSHVACSLNPFQDYFNFYTAVSRTFQFETENLTWNQV